MIRYHNITTQDMVNGDGLRVVLWVAGCDHRCDGCHNSIAWSHTSGLVFDTAAFEELKKELEKDYITGITFSGGDPLSSGNAQSITSLSNTLKRLYPEKTQWLYTGDIWENVKYMDIVKNLEVVVDGEFEISKQDVTLRWKGSSNQRVINVQKSLENISEDPIIWCKEKHDLIGE